MLYTLVLTDGKSTLRGQIYPETFGATRLGTPMLRTSLTSRNEVIDRVHLVLKRFTYLTALSNAERYQSDH